MANTSRLELRISIELRKALERIQLAQGDDDLSKTVRGALDQFVELHPLMDEIKKFLHWRASEVEGLG